MSVLNMLKDLKTTMPNMITVEKDVLFEADLDTVHRVLLDTEEYPDFHSKHCVCQGYPQTTR